jgi:hypothetical protein
MVRAQHVAIMTSSTSSSVSSQESMAHNTGASRKPTRRHPGLPAGVVLLLHTNVNKACKVLMWGHSGLSAIPVAEHPLVGQQS